MVSPERGIKNKPTKLSFRSLLTRQSKRMAAEDNEAETNNDSMVFNKTWYVSWATSISLKIGVHQIKKERVKETLNF